MELVSFILFLSLHFYLGPLFLDLPCKNRYLRLTKQEDVLIFLLFIIIIIVVPALFHRHIAVHTCI